MSVEQVARDFVTTMTDVEKTKAYLTANAMVSGGVLPQPMPAMETLNLISAMTAAFPDLKFDVQKVTVNGNQATVNVELSGTNSGTLSMPLPGMPGMIPATGKKVSVPDTLIVTVDGDKVSHLNIDSPAGGGLAGVLAQMGVKMPGMM
jgi:predicted ester cyclase